MINWAEAYAWLISQPPGKAQAQLLRLASTKVRIKPPRPKVKLPRGQRKESIPKLKKELDRVFSIFIRTRDCGLSLYGMCRTCRNTYPSWKEMDAGHYVPRQDLATRWDEKNVHLQCKRCNGFRGGEPEKMAAYIDSFYGPGTAESLRAQSKRPFKLSRSWLEGKIKEYKGKIRE